MSIWNTLEKGFNKFQEMAEKKSNQMYGDMNRYENQYLSLDDDELKEIYKSESGVKKYAAANVLKERGYGK